MPLNSYLSLNMTAFENEDGNNDTQIVDVLENIFENLFYPPKENIIREEDDLKYKVQDDGQISFF